VFFLTSAELFEKGGPVMYLLLLCSLTVAAIAIDRFLLYRRASQGARALEADVAVGIEYFVFVERAFFKVGDEDIPDAALRVETHDVAAAIPEVEVADDGDAPRIRRPDTEADTCDTIDFNEVRTELFVRP